jgi:pimeloyl-ACP methyl ester carboxylesterase
MTRIVYLHGFASSPASTKSRFFAAKFAGISVPFENPELDEGNFETLTVTGQLQVVDRAVNGDPVILMGSSLGGYLAALYASSHANVERLVLLAPAFQFPSRWRQRFREADFADWKRNGVRSFYHYGYQEDRPLGYRFAEDSVQCKEEPDFSQPALIFHGVRDDVVPVEVSRKYAAAHPNVTLVEIAESGHALTDALEPMWRDTLKFLAFQNR